MTAPVLNSAAIQGIVLRGYRMPVGSYLFLRVLDPAAARRWIGALIPTVQTAARWPDAPGSVVNVAFSAAGLRALEVPDETMMTFSTPFLQGMAARAETHLGDTAESAPRHWQAGLGGPDVHLLVMLGAQDAVAMADREDRLLASLGGALRVSARQHVAMLPGRTEHFGFTDGFSQPDVEGAEAGPRTGQGVFSGGETWRPVRAGEFVLGYPDEEDVLPAAPKPEQLARNGSYLAVRKLNQDVAGFRAMLRAAARLLPGGEEHVAAKLVGRWRDGTPLAISPDGPDHDLVEDADRNNAFDYADDAAGYRCPLGAHIRRANPRRSLPFDGKLVNRHRLVRRGLPYGPPFDPDNPDAEERGVMFACFQADLARQFEFIQSQWLNDGNAFGLGADKDPLLGNNDGTGKFTVHGAPPRFVASIPRFVTTVGGEYLFAPGINGLRYLSRTDPGGG